MLFNLDDVHEDEQIEKARTHEEVCAKYISEAISADLEFQIGPIKPGNSYHFDTDAKWSLHDLVVYCLKEAGPANVYFATYAIKEYQARLLVNLKTAGAIKEIHALLDYRNELMAPDAYQLLMGSATTIGTMRTHAKLVVIEGERLQIVITGSANFTTNTRADVGVITCVKEISEFRKNWIQKNIQDGIIK